MVELDFGKALGLLDAVFLKYPSSSELLDLLYRVSTNATVVSIFDLYSPSLPSVPRSRTDFAPNPSQELS